MLLAILGDAVYEAWSPSSSNVGSSWLGLSPPVAMALLSLLIGIAVMIGQRIVSPDPYFRWKRQVADPSVLEPEPEVAHG